MRAAATAIPAMAPVLSPAEPRQYGIDSSTNQLNVPFWLMQQTSIILLPI